jgi:acetolactate synthase I/II/III large subunit
VTNDRKRLAAAGDNAVCAIGSIKLIVSQAWRSTQQLTFFESNGLSAMGYSLPAAMAAKLALPDRPVLGTMADGGCSMVLVTSRS